MSSSSIVVFVEDDDVSKVAGGPHGVALGFVCSLVFCCSLACIFLAFVECVLLGFARIVAFPLLETVLGVTYSGGYLSIRSARLTDVLVLASFL